LQHYPVLLNEVLDYLNIDAEGTYLDCTVGEAGHAEAILSRLTTGRLIAIDRDGEAVERARLRLADYKEKVSLSQASYSDIDKVAGGEPLQGIVADLGLSRRHFETPDRGFSFQREGPLDMRIDQRQGLTADQIVNTYDEKRLADLIFRHSQERRSRRIARTIVRGRPIRNTTQLAATVERAVPRSHRRRIHPATKTFQAIRIAVNDEITELENMLEGAPALLAQGGRMVVISFHSLEDRCVKVAYRRWRNRSVFKVLTPHVVRPSRQEIRQNPSSRSAKLRAAERTPTVWPLQN
jgi:16S rRNA (cytosine1402-N4)-methyltransferase